jgi:hypothetical protein
VLEHASRLLEKDRTGGRQCHAAAIAVEQPDPHLSLQSADLTAQRRLDDVHACGGAPEVQLFGHGDEVAEMAGLDDAAKVSQHVQQGLGRIRNAISYSTA